MILGLAPVFDPSIVELSEARLHNFTSKIVIGEVEQIVIGAVHFWEAYPVRIDEPAKAFKLFPEQLNYLFFLFPAFKVSL